MKEITKVLLKTRKEIETHKLAKGDFAKKANGHTICSPLDKDVGCLCLLGALHRATNTDPYQEEWSDKFPELNKEFDRLFLKMTDNKFSCPISVFHPDYCSDEEFASESCPDDFNDHPETTKQDVLNLLDGMIALSRMNV